MLEIVAVTLMVLGGLAITGILLWTTKRFIEVSWPREQPAQRTAAFIAAAMALAVVGVIALAAARPWGNKTGGYVVYGSVVGGVGVSVVLYTIAGICAWRKRRR